MSDDTGDAAEAVFEERRRPLLRLAYRMLGSAADAEDIVQDAYLRWHAADPSGIDQPRAFLTTIVTRLCLDHLKSARAKRETYVGAWLPEPLVELAGPAAAEPHRDLELAEDLSVALMLTLERLSPLERAAFLLHDVFELGFDAVAATLGRSPAACRQLAHRARTQVRAAPRRFPASPGAAESLTRAFIAASRDGDVATLQTLLSGDVVLVSDGGGKRTAALNPIRGGDRVVRFLAGVARKFATGPENHRFAWINGLPGFITVDENGRPQTTALEFDGEVIAAIYIVRNPDKLGRLPPAAGPDAAGPGPDG